MQSSSETTPGKTRNSRTRDLVVLPALFVIVLVESQMNTGVWRFFWPLLAVSLLSRPALKAWACVLIVRVLLISVVTWSPLDWAMSSGFLAVRTAFAWIMLVQGKLLARHRVAQALCRRLLPYPGLVRKVLIVVVTALVLGVIFIDVSRPYAYLCLAGFLVYLTIRLPRPTRTTERGIRRQPVETGLVVASVLFCLALFELAVRLTVPPPPVARGNVYRPHPRAIFCCAEDAEAEHITEEFRCTYATSDQGFRDRHYDKKEDSTYRILCLGDSSTMGGGVHLNETYAKVLERLLAEQNLNKRIEVINAGTCAYGVWQERIILEERGFALEPDMVILQLHPQTDVRDALVRVGKVTRSYHLDWQKTLELWRKRRTTAPTKTLRRYSRGFAFIYRRYVQLQDQLQHRLRGRFRRAVRRFPPSEDERPHWFESSLSTYYPELEEGWELLEESVCGIANSCRERQIAFLLFVIPALHEVCDGELERVTDLFGVEPELYDLDKTLRLVRDMTTRNGIAFVETLDRFKQLSDNRGCPYYIVDGHVIAEGHAVCAEALCEHLMETNLQELSETPA